MPHVDEYARCPSDVFPMQGTGYGIAGPGCSSVGTTLTAPDEPPREPHPLRGNTLNDLTKNILLWVVIAVVSLAVFSRYMPAIQPVQDIAYSTFLEDVKEAASPRSASTGQRHHPGKRNNGEEFQAYNPETDNTALIGLLQKADVKFEGTAAEAAVVPGAAAHLLVPDPAADRRLRLHAAPDAGRVRRPRRHVLRQEPRAAAGRRPGQRHVRGRRGRRRGEAGSGRDRRLPQGPGQVPEARRQDPARAC